MVVKVCIVKTQGTNCDEETRHAFNLVNADAEIVHLSTLRHGYNPITRRKTKLKVYQIAAIPGGFSGGDYINAGEIFAQDLKDFIGDQIQEFVNNGGLIIGICNGFQVLVKYGLLPALNNKIDQISTLTNNTSLRFRDDWVKLVKPVNARECVWTKDIENIDLPIAHGEGKFVAPQKLLDIIFEKGLVQLQYANEDLQPTIEFPYNPNGSLGGIAGICNENGRIFGLMPHPERYLRPQRHRLATLQAILSRDYVDKTDFVRGLEKTIGRLPSEGPGLQIFKNGVNYFR